jgi:hypothetical protein
VAAATVVVAIRDHLGLFLTAPSSSLVMAARIVELRECEVVRSARAAREACPDKGKTLPSWVAATASRFPAIA